MSSDIVGTYFNIGSWNANDLHGKSNAIIKDLKITKLAARGTHVSSCYKTETVHSTTIQYVAIPKKFNYTGGVQYYTVPETGYYRIDSYGASGGDGYGSGIKIAQPSVGGLGGYASGEAYLLKGQQLAVYVGGQGESNVITYSILQRPVPMPICTI